MSNPNIERLLDIMARLRHPQTGCPWDREQSFASIVPYTIEEAYEVADAIERGDMADLRDELGDLVFQVVFYAQMAREQGDFDFGDVVSAIVDKMVRRHPHVFADAEIADAHSQTLAWEAHKAKERAAKSEQQSHHVLDGVARSLPALTRAGKLQRRAARVGFDWPEIHGVLDRVLEELEEVRAELQGGGSCERVSSEVGDLLFACVNLARHAGVDSETALRAANARFEQRFRAVESALADRGKTCHEASLEEMDELWEEAKQ